jgi:acyl-CoA synthetase (AMP-forming)/AMP-acid ligase II
MFTDYLDRGYRINRHGAAVTSRDGTASFTHAELWALSHRVAEALRKRGVGPDTPVAVYSPNDAAALVCVSGIFRAGATWVALNPRSEIEELAELLQLVDCEFLIYHYDFADRAAQLSERVPTIRETAEIGGDPEVEVGSWLAAPGQKAPRLPFDSGNVAAILGTGGTTGRAKAVPITTRQLMCMCMCFNAHLYEAQPPVFIMAPPMTHAAGLMAWPVLAEGGTVVVHDGVHADEIFDSTERHRTSRIFLPPTAIYTLLADPAVRAVDFSSLRHFVYAAAPMSADKLLEAIDVFGPVMAQTFGQAEAPMICTSFSPADHERAARDPAKRHWLSSCGRPSLGTAVEIMSEHGRLVGDGDHGEIVVRGELVMGGYHRNPEATAETRRPGGWHGTGDIGYRDSDGFVYIVDRKRDLIISGGFNVFPSAVERVVWGHPAVLDCAVIGLPDPKWGEAVTAVVELKNGYEVEASELIGMCKAALGSVQAPKSVIFRPLPRSANGKVLKRVLRDEYWIGQARRV